MKLKSGEILIRKPAFKILADKPPEYADYHGARYMFGLNRAHLYVLANEGKIRTVCIRRPGAKRGRRLFDCESIRKFLEQNVDLKKLP
jgi:hypothetical protein